MRFFFTLLSMLCLVLHVQAQQRPGVQTRDTIRHPVMADPANQWPSESVIRRVTIIGLEAYISQCDHPLIVNFWATYCTPCVKEIPYFQSTVEKYKDKGVELLLVSLDRSDAYPTRIASFVKKNSYTSSIAWLDETDTRYFCPRIDQRWSGGLPSSLFINNKTRYRRFFDRQLTDGQVAPAIEAMLGQPPNAP